MIAAATLPYSQSPGVLDTTKVDDAVAAEHVEDVGVEVDEVDAGLTVETLTEFVEVVDALEPAEAEPITDVLTELKELAETV